MYNTLKIQYIEFATSLFFYIAGKKYRQRYLQIFFNAYLCHNMVKYITLTIIT